MCQSQPRRVFIGRQSATEHAILRMSLRIPAALVAEAGCCKADRGCRRRAVAAATDGSDGRTKLVATAVS